MVRNSLEHAIRLVEMGKPIEAQKVLKPLIAADHHDLAAWFWFVETCSTKKQRLDVLEICLDYNPDNEQIKQALDRLHSASSQNSSVRDLAYSVSSSGGESAKISIPDNIKVSKGFQRLHIAVKWFRFKFIVLTLFIIGFDAFFLSAGYSTAFPFEMTIAVTVNIGLIYYALAGYLNTTFIDVNFNSIIVKYEPLPTWGEKRISTKTVTQLYVDGDYFFGIENKRTGYHFYNVNAITNDRRIVKLVQGLENNEASFVKQEIEKFLNIDGFAHLG